MPRPGGACSSYLVRSRETAVVLDVGIGAFAKLALAMDYTKLDAIVISHMHADHFFDLVPFRYALKYGHLRPSGRIPVWLPPGGLPSLEALRHAVSSDTPADFFQSVFDVREFDPQRPLVVGELELRFAATRHFVAAYAVRAQCGADTVTYSADTAPCEAVVELARGSAIFLCENGLALESEVTPHRGHTSSEEAGEMAQRANVGRLLLTHYPAGVASEALVEAAKRKFDGSVEAVEDGMTLLV